MHIWVTEWNAAGIGAGAMPWAEALGTAAVLDSYLRDGRVTMQCYHTFSDAAGIPRGRAAAQTAGDGAALPPLGQVLALFGKAMRGMTQAAPLAFSPDETISAAGDPRHPYPLRFGWVFENEQAARAIVANLSEQPVRLRSAESASGARVRMLAADALAAAPAVEAVESQIGDSLDMPPWSIALVEAANGGR